MRPPLAPAEEICLHSLGWLRRNALLDIATLLPTRLANVLCYPQLTGILEDRRMLENVYTDLDGHQQIARIRTAPSSTHTVKYGTS